MCVLQDGGGQAVSTAEFKHLSREDQEVKKTYFKTTRNEDMLKRTSIPTTEKKTVGRGKRLRNSQLQNTVFLLQFLY